MDTRDPEKMGKCDEHKLEKDFSKIEKKTMNLMSNISKNLVYKI